MGFPTRTATSNADAFSSLRAAAGACGINLGGLNEVDAIALCLANLFDTLATATAGQGYLTGAGSAQTQQTNKSTGVTMNTVVGAITMNNASLAGATGVTFQVNNTAVQANDVISVIHASAGTAGAYLVVASTPVAATSFQITVRNQTAGALAEAIVLNYMIERGAAS